MPFWDKLTKEWSFEEKAPRTIPLIERCTERVGFSVNYKTKESDVLLCCLTKGHEIPHSIFAGIPDITITIDTRGMGKT